MKRYLKYLSITLTAVFALASCTDLEIEETDSFISEGFQGLANPASSLDQLYNNIYGQWADQANRYALYEVTTDALLVPTRGADWGDNGRWRKLHQHEWGLEEADILTPFDQYNANQLLASQILDSRSGATTDVAAQAHFLRAYSMFTVLDLFGQIPFRDTQLSSSAVPEVLSGAAAVDFILADLDAAIAGLPSVQAGTGDLRRASKAAARLLKAKVLLNRHIYESQLVEPYSVSPNAADMQEVINLVDAIDADGYELQAGYFEIFESSPDTETMWWGTADVGNRIFNGLHYRSTELQGGGWNGFSTLAEYYDLFQGDANQNRYGELVGGEVVNGDIDQAIPLDGQEERRGGVPNIGVDFTGAPETSDNGGKEAGSNVGYGFLIGQQYGLQGDALTDRQGEPLVFSREFEDANGNSSLINNDEKTGIRVMKYNPRFGGGRLGHNIILRYADAYLMRAEARMRSGGDPTPEVNTLRVLRGATPLANISESELLNERARELYAEGWRRNDLIRFGEYLRNWEFKADTDPKRLLFPIPLPQLLANPNLQQNPGY